MSFFCNQSRQSSFIFLNCFGPFMGARGDEQMAQMERCRHGFLVVDCVFVLRRKQPCIRRVSVWRGTFVAKVDLFFRSRKVEIRELERDGFAAVVTDKQVMSRQTTTESYPDSCHFRSGRGGVVEEKESVWWRCGVVPS